MTWWQVRATTADGERGFMAGVEAEDRESVLLMALKALDGVLAPVDPEITEIPPPSQR